jgi:GAF domain-containing protein
LVDDIRSCYTGGDAVGRGFVGSASLRDGGARVVVVLPLWAQRVRLGSVVLAHSRPLQLDGEEIRALETLADHVASALASSRHTKLPLRSGWSSGARRRRSFDADARAGTPEPATGII